MSSNVDEWFDDDIRKSSCDDGKHNSRYDFIKRKSPELPSRPCTHTIRWVPLLSIGIISSEKYGFIHMGVEKSEKNIKFDEHFDDNNCFNFSL